MATGQGNTNTYTSSGYTLNWCVLVEYNVTSITDTALNYEAIVKVYHINADTSKQVSLSSGVVATLSIGGSQVTSYTTTSSHTLYAGTANAWKLIPYTGTSYTGSISRTTSPQTVSLSASVKLNNWGKGTSTFTDNSAFTVPARAIPGYCKIGGSIKSGIFYTKVNGNIVTPTVGYVKVGGTWKQIS